MPKKSNTLETPAELRRRAERQAKERHLETAAPRTAADARRQQHELEVHQIELEMQNAELQVTRDKVEEMLVKYTDLFDFAPLGYFTLTAEGRIREVNLAGAGLLGIARGELVKQRFRFLVALADRPVFDAFLKQVFAGEASVECEAKLLVEGKQPVDVRMIANVLDAGQACRMAVVNITEHKRADAVTAQLAAIVNSSSDAIIGKDLGGIVTTWNAGAEHMFGYSAAEMVGCSITRLIPAGRRREFDQIMDRIRNGKTVEHFETLRMAKDVRLLDVSLAISPIREASGKIAGASIVARDITERKHAEELLRRNETLFSSLIEQAPVGVYAVDAAFRLQQVNPMAMPVFSHVEPLVGRDFAEIIHIVWPKRVADGIVARFRHTLATGEPYQSPEFAERRRDIGVKEHYEWQIQRVTLPAGEHGVVCFFNNITERKKSEAAHHRLDLLTASNQKLKLEIIRRQAIEDVLQKSEQQQSRLLQQSRVQQKQLRELSHQILHAQEEERKRISRELHDVIAQTLVGINVHLTALTHGTPNIPAAFKRKITRTRTLVEQSVDIVHRFARELRPTMLDDLGLIPALQAFMKSYMEDTGIRVSLNTFAGIEQAPTAVRTVLFRVTQEALGNVARHAKASQVEVSIRCPDVVIRMEIKDNGQGFDVSGASSAKKHNRLGLIGMRERVEMIGGTFHVESAPGQPTTVHVEIPAGDGGRKKE